MANNHDNGATRIAMYLSKAEKDAIWKKLGVKETGEGDSYDFKARLFDKVGLDRPLTKAEAAKQNTKKYRDRMRDQQKDA